MQSHILLNREVFNLIGEKSEQQGSVESVVLDVQTVGV